MNSIGKLDIQWPQKARHPLKNPASCSDVFLLLQNLSSAAKELEDG